MIAYYRQQAGLTQAELSEKVGMSQEWTSQVERGRIKRPRVDVLMRISKVLDAPLDQLVTATGYGSAAGVPVKVVSGRLGHATGAITMDLYGHLLSDMQDGAAAVMDALLREA